MSDSTWWRACQKPRGLLQFVRYEATHRKRRLLATAFCRRLLPWLDCPVLHHAVTVCEQRADGLASLRQLSDARRQLNEQLLHFDADLQLLARHHDQARTRFHWLEWSHLPEIEDAERRLYQAMYRARAAEVISLLVRSDTDLSPHRIAEAVCELIYVRARSQGPASPALRELQQQEAAYQCDLVRDVFGNPFRRTEPTWVSADAVRLAQALYEERAWDQLPILGDALEEAGCSDDEVLQHCRGPVLHTRGCWAIDLVLGRR